MYDRGKISLLSCAEDTFLKEWSKNNPETRANRYASDLLMPVSIFKPRAKAYKSIDFETVNPLQRSLQRALRQRRSDWSNKAPCPQC
jgi:Zn-dependent peptidase ImmA (M78 family)